MIFEGCFDFAAACSSVYSELGGDGDTNSVPNPCEIMAGGLPDVVPPAAMAIGSKGMALAASKFNLALGSLDALRQRRLRDLDDVLRRPRFGFHSGWFPRWGRHRHWIRGW
jgi:hypothetical protein